MIFHAMEASDITDVREVLNVGDTRLDVQAGRRAGILGSIGVLTGIQKREDLLLDSPSHILSSVADVPSLVEAQYL
jgi:phosphoglycolate phosphatase